MKRTKTLLMTSALFMGSLLNSFAQSQDCEWDLTDIVGQPTCNGSCNGFVSVAPSVNWPFTYLWSNGSTSNTIENLCADEYVVTVSDDKGCSEVHVFSIVDPAALAASCTTLTNESAPGAMDGSIAASATGGTGSYTFVWQTEPNVFSSTITGLSGGTYYVLVSDENDCTTSTSCTIITEKKKKECEGFRTQTMGGWGQCQQNGNNPGSYLFANFAAAFPNGLEIGCTNKLRLTNPTAVCEFLPAGGQPKALNAGTMTNNTTYKNVFAGQLVTATINVMFDYNDADFSDSEVNLGDMIIASGLFQGWTMNALLAEANLKIGGCASSYTHSQLSDALSDFNENYKDGVTDNGFLVCPDAEAGRVAGSNESAMKMSVYPNPTDNIAFVDITTDKDATVEVALYNISGQKVMTAYNGVVEAGMNKIVKIDGSEMVSGIYFVKVISGSQVYNQKLMLKK